MLKCGELEGVPTDCVDGFPKMMSVFNKVDQLSEIKAWNAAH